MRYAGCRRVIVSFGVQKWLPSWQLPHGFSDYMLDSGGYQVAQGTGTRKVYVKSYSYWVTALLDRYADRISAYMNLDVDSEDYSHENLCYMEIDDLHPVPVWKDGWSDDLLIHYTENYPYIAIGGLAGKRKPTRYHANLARRLISRFPSTKFHFFGMGVSTSNFYKDYQPYSVDFSTYLNPVRFGQEVVLDKGRVKCREMDEPSKQRITHDKEFADQKIIDAVRNVLRLEER